MPNPYVSIYIFQKVSDDQDFHHVEKILLYREKFWTLKPTFFCVLARPQKPTSLPWENSAQSCSGVEYKISSVQ